jgi:hypothetical protein
VKKFSTLEIFIDKCTNLGIIDPNEDFIVCINACKEGLGGVLSQNGQVICYESRKLKEHERQCATHYLELAAIVHAYLMRRRFELRIDHSGLKYLFGQPTLNVRQIRWLEFLSKYDFDINHIKGKENKVADTLNRRVHEMHVTTINMYKCDYNHGPPVLSLTSPLVHVLGSF